MTRVIDKMAMMAKLYDHGGPAMPRGQRPHAGQEAMHKSTARFRVSSWGRRAGKSFGGATDVVPNFFAPHTDGFPHIGWIVAPNYELGEREYRVLFHHLINKLEVPTTFRYFRKASGDMALKTPWGSEVWVKSAERPDKGLLGEGLSWVIMAEAARLDRSIWDQYIEPSLADREGTALFTTTPLGINWVYAFFQRGQSPEHPDWDSWTFPSWVNTFRFPGGIRFLRKRDEVEVPWDMVAKDPALEVYPHPESNSKLVQSWQNLSRHYFWQEYGAQFRTQAGRIYPEFDEGYHVIDYEFVPGRKNYRTIDYGTTNPFVCLDIQTDEYDNVYVWREWRRVGYSTQDNVRWVTPPEQLPYQMEAVIGDPYEPDGRLTTENEWNIPIQFVTIGVKNGIELVERWLNLHTHTDDTVKPKLFVDRSCRGMIEEMKAYRWKRTLDEELFVDEDFQLQQDENTKEEPLKQNDHAPDALRNFMAWWKGDTLVHHAENQYGAWNDNMEQDESTGDPWMDNYLEHHGGPTMRGRHSRDKLD